MAACVDFSKGKCFRQNCKYSHAGAAAAPAYGGSAGYGGYGASNGYGQAAGASGSATDAFYNAYAQQYASVS